MVPTREEAEQFASQTDYRAARLCARVKTDIQRVTNDLELGVARYLLPHFIPKAHSTAMNENAPRSLSSLFFDVFYVAAKLLEVLQRRFPLFAFDDNRSFILVD